MDHFWITYPLNPPPPNACHTSTKQPKSTSIYLERLGNPWNVCGMQSIAYKGNGCLMGKLRKLQRANSC